MRELGRAGSLHARPGDLGWGGLGELLLRGAELQDSGNAVQGRGGA